MHGKRDVGHNGRMRIDMEELYAAHPFAREILNRLKEAGHKAVVVGGAVRDMLLASLSGKSFVPKEVDIATSAPPEEVRRLFRDRPVLAVEEAFGVVVVGARLAEPPSSP